MVCSSEETIRVIEVAAGVGMSLIASEHFFSTFLSSPWTTEKFATEEEDKAKVRRLYMMAVGASMATAIVMAIILKQPWPLVAASILCVMYVLVYEKAMRGGI